MSHAKACHWGRKSFRKSRNFRTEGLAASARIDHGPLRVREQFNASVEISARYRAGCRISRNRFFRIGFDRRFPDVGRNFQSYGPRPSAAESSEGISQRFRSNCATIDHLRLLGQRRQRSGLLRNFMKQAVSSADACGREMAYKRQQRRIHAVCSHERRGRIQQARSRNNAKRLLPSGRHRRAQGHVGRALLVPRRNGGQRVRSVVHCVEEIIILEAGQAINVFDSVENQRVRNKIGNCPGHVRLLDMLAASHSTRVQRPITNNLENAQSCAELAHSCAAVEPPDPDAGLPPDLP